MQNPFLPIIKGAEFTYKNMMMIMIKDNGGYLDNCLLSLKLSLASVTEMIPIVFIE